MSHDESARGSHDVHRPEVEVGYEEWLERLDALYRSVSFCCWHRIGDRLLADEIAAQVVAGLVAKPRIFKYFGLPFSGRVARLTERGIADARNGTLSRGRGWDRLVADLRSVPPEERQMLVIGWLDGRDDGEVAALLSLDVDTVRAQRAASEEFWRGLAATALPPIVDPP